MKLSFLLLLATGRDIFLATSILIPSIKYYFNLENLEEILIVIKNNDLNLLNLRLEELKNKNIILPIRIIKETEIFDKSSNYNNTYYLQMYLKLLSANFIKSDYYLTLDADTLFLNKSESNTFFDKNKAFYYKIKKKDRWLARSSKLMDLDFDKIKFSINQTPFVFKKDLVKKMLNDIDVKNYIIKKNCSEYTLYYAYLLKNNLFESNYQENHFIKIYIKYPHNHLNNNQLLKLLKIIKHSKNKISIIQSRINVHYKLKDIIKEVVPNSYYNKPKIGLLTVVSGEKYNERYKKGFQIKKDYCKYHNYEFLFHEVNNNDFKMKNGWIKIYKLLEYLHLYDYIMCSDADVILTNRDIRIEDIIFRYMKESHIGLITTDYITINSGNIIWKNDPKTYQLLNEMIKIGEKSVRYSINKPFLPKGIYEQPNLIYLFNNYFDIQKSLKIIPQFEMNSYTKLFPQLLKKNCIKTICNVNNRCNWKNGDFLVHFAGMNYLQNNKFKIEIETVIEKFVKRYYENISSKEGTDYSSIK